MYLCFPSTYVITRFYMVCCLSSCDKYREGLILSVVTVIYTSIAAHDCIEPRDSLDKDMSILCAPGRSYIWHLRNDICEALINKKIKLILGETKNILLLFTF